LQVEPLLYFTTAKKNFVVLPKSPGLNPHRSEVFHGATTRSSRDCMLLSGVLFIDHSRRYWNANNGNSARFLPVSSFHSPKQITIDIAHHCPLDIAVGGPDRQPSRTTGSTTAITSTISIQEEDTVSISALRPKRWLRNYQNRLQAATY
jgi:hypothetical protein